MAGDLKHQASASHALLSSSVLKRSTYWSLLGQIIPLLTAVIAFPFLLAELGKERFGVLSLIWMTIGYLSLFDLGLGRALTKLVAEKIAQQRCADIPKLMYSTQACLVFLGGLGALLLYCSASWLVHQGLVIKVELQDDVLQSIYLLAFSLPLVVSTTALRGFLEAYQRFDLVNLVRIPLGVLTFLGPLLVWQYAQNLSAIVLFLIVVRVIVWCAYVILCVRVEKRLYHMAWLDRAALKQLFSFGGWITVSNVVGPLMTYLDRFLIGGMLTMTAVAYYVTPYEIVTKLWFVPVALMSVLFPAFSLSMSSDPAHAGRLYDKGLKLVCVLMLPLVAVFVAFGADGLTLWLGHDFSMHAVSILQWLAVGVFVNSIAQVPFALLQGGGRPDVTAKLHLVELPFYVLLLYWMIELYGINGAAFAWFIRAVIDAVCLFVLTAKIFPDLQARQFEVFKYVFFCAMAFVLLCWLEAVVLKLLVLLCICMVCVYGLYNIKRQIQVKV